MGFDDAFLFACFNLLTVGSTSKEKGDSAEDYAFARAGFTADDGKPFAEVDIKLVDSLAYWFRFNR